MATTSGGEGEAGGLDELSKFVDRLAGELRRAVGARFDPRIAVSTGETELDGLLTTILAAARSPLPPEAGELEAVHQELERQVAERRRQEALLHYIIANVPFSIFWKDREGRFLGGNDNFVNDMRIASMADFVGKNDYEVGFPPAQADFFVKCDREVMETGRPLLDIEESQEQADGTHTLLTSKVPLRDEAGRTIGLLGIYADITERKRMEEQLLRAKEAAEAAARAKSEFLTTMSHELRTPLTLILGPIEALLSDPTTPLPAVARDHVERMRRNAGRLFMLVNDILDFSRIEAGGMVVRREPVDIGELVTQVIDDARPVAEQRGLSLKVELETASPTGSPTVSPTVSIDRRLFEKILLNLLGNALKFTPAGGSINVVICQGTSTLELAITDTGPGIQRDQLPLLFRRFQQLDTSATRKYEGTGIGLALVKEFAALLGGTVGVESEVGRGSRFFVRLPIDEGRVIAAPARVGSRRERPSVRFERISERFASIGLAGSSPSERTPANSTTRPRVLVGEDNADMRAYIVETLASDYAVEAVGSGRAVFDAARRETPEVIISDVMMPEMDGIELVGRLKSDPELRQVPVILVTARASREELVGGLNLGADDYLGKPFVAAELRARVRAAQRLHRLYRDLADQHRQLKETQEQLVHAAKMAAMGTLVAGLSHELNNPLTAIVMNSQSLSRRLPPSSPLSDAVAAIERQARRCSRLVKTLLDFSRQKPSLRETVSVASLLERVAELTGSQASERGVRLVIAPSPPDLPPLHGCVQEIESALLNLVGNAFDATSPGGSVTLAAESERGGIELSVCDTGSGIPPEILARVFDPFFTSKPVGQGTGLGLTITRRIVEAHGGAIHIDSAPGRGTQVRAWLPHEPTESAAQASDSLSEARR